MLPPQHDRPAGPGWREGLALLAMLIVLAVLAAWIAAGAPLPS